MKNRKRVKYISKCLFLLLFLLLQSGKLGKSEENGKTENAPNDPNRTVLNVLPGELIGVIVEVLDIMMLK